MDEVIIALGRAQDAANHGALNERMVGDVYLLLAGADVRGADVDEYLTCRAWYRDLVRELRARMAA